MTPKQTQYVITYDDFNEIYLCKIDENIISASFVGEILSYIARLYEYEPKIIYTDFHFAKAMEEDLNITIEIKD